MGVYVGGGGLRTQRQWPRVLTPPPRNIKKEEDASSALLASTTLELSNHSNASKAKDHVHIIQKHTS